MNDLCSVDNQRAVHLVRSYFGNRFIQDDAVESGRFKSGLIDGFEAFSIWSARTDEKSNLRIDSGSQV
jgi:hypothetical protein